LGGLGTRRTASRGDSRDFRPRRFERHSRQGGTRPHGMTDATGPRAFDSDAGLLSMNDPGVAVDPYDHEVFRLPCDFYPTASHPRWEAYAFELPLSREGACEFTGIPAVAAALCVLFARLTGHGTIPLRFLGSSTAERTRATSMRILAAPACPAADIIAQIAESLEATRDTDPGGPSPSSGADADAVELVFVDALVGSNLTNAALGDSPGANAPLRLLLPVSAPRSGVAFAYDAHRFTATTIERFAEIGRAHV